MANQRNRKMPGQGTRERLARELEESHRRQSQNERQRRCRERRSEGLRAVCEELESQGSEGFNINVERSTSRVAENFAIQWFQETAGRGLEYQRSLIPKILKHVVWQGVLPNYSEMENAWETVGNIARGWQQIKGCHSKDDQRARNVIIPMVASRNTNMRQTSLLTGIHRRNFYVGIVRRLSLDARVDRTLWALCGKSKRIDATPPNVCELIVDFWCLNSRVSPNRKDVVRKRIDSGMWETHATHHLMESQVHLTMALFYIDWNVSLPKLAHCLG
jgi:hypothetical protein